MSTQTRIVVGRREAGDSVDFHARHGHALHARAAREGIETMLALYRTWRRRRATAQPGWHVEWPAGPQISRQ